MAEPKSRSIDPKELEQDRDRVDRLLRAIEEGEVGEEGEGRFTTRFPASGAKGWGVPPAPER
jgi:hypothetical protein